MGGLKSVCKTFCTFLVIAQKPYDLDSLAFYFSPNKEQLTFIQPNQKLKFQAN